MAVALAAASLQAQDVAGAWQGTLASELGTLRAVLEIVKVDGTNWKVVVFSVDQSGFDHGVPASSLTFADSSLAIRFDQIGATLTGRVTSDGNSIRGTWKQNDESVPLTFWRATNETLWRDPLAHLAPRAEDTTARRRAASFSAQWIRACGSIGVPASDTGFVFGHVAHLAGVPPDTSDYVQAAWSGERVPGDSLSVERATVSRAHLKDDGSYAICGIPVPQTVSLRAVRGGLSAPVITMRLTDSRIAQRDLTLATEMDMAALDTGATGVRTGAGATITGVVVDELRRRIAGASVHVRGAAASATTDANGRFVIADVPPGVRTLQISGGSRASLLLLADAYAGDTVAVLARLGASAGAERAAMDSRSVIRGVVTDSTRSTLEGIEVYVVNSGRSARTDRAGRFRIDSLVEGPTELRARRVGWNPVDTTVVLVPHADISLNFRFRTPLSALDTIRVNATQAACKPRDFEGFECRKKAGLGVFIDPVRVDSINPRYIADLFDGIPGFRRVGKNVLPTDGDRCVTMLINGHPPMPVEAMQLAQADARDIVAVEAYTDPKTYPEWYKMYSWMGEGGFKAKQCSLIVLWTEGPPAKP